MRYVPVVILGVLLLPCAVSAQDTAKVEQGEKLYATLKCGACHSIAGKGNKKGPLDEVGTKLTADQIREWIVNPKEMTKKTNSTRKPLMKEHPNLAPAEVDALVAYMQSLKKS